MARQKGITRVGLVAVLLAGGALTAVAPAGAAAGPAAPLLHAPVDMVPGTYNVVLDGEPAAVSAASQTGLDDALTTVRALGGQIRHEYRTTVNGFSARLTAGQLDAVRRLPGVAYVSPVTEFSSPTVQTPVENWGLDRIDQRTLPLDTAYHYTATGAGVTAYVLDSGLRATHVEFAGRVLPGVNVSLDGTPLTDSNDYCGHGTYTTGILAGSVHGVAKGVSILPVRMRSATCAGAGDDIIAAVEWVTNHHAERPGPALALIEGVSYWQDPVFNSAVQTSIDSGISYITAAGNENIDACTVAPTSVLDAITVGASDRDDNRSLYSSWGSCVDLFAPGDDVISTAYDSDTATVQSGGTSASAPFAAGVAAQYLEGHPTATPAQVEAALVGAATVGVLSTRDTSSPNRLLSNDFTTPLGFAAQHGNLAPGAPNDNAIQADLRVLATTTQTVDLSQVTLRYWFTRDGGASSYTVACDYAQLGCSHVTERVVTLAAARTGADAYFEVGFTSGTTALPAGTSTGPIQLRWHKSDWSAFAEANDYSYRASSSVSDNVKVTGYYQGQLVWGTEP